jgi:hypothetical protein
LQVDLDDDISIKREITPAVHSIGGGAEPQEQAIVCFL